MSKRDEYTYDLAETVSNLFAAGTNDPSAEEIAHAHFSTAPHLGGAIIEDVRKKLQKIKSILQGEDYGYDVCPLGSRYYVEHRVDKTKRKAYRLVKPTTKQEAKLCLPVGQGCVCEGLWLSSGSADDVIWQASIELGINAGGGRLKRGIDRTIAGVADGRIPSQRGGELLNGARKSITTLPPLVQIKQMQLQDDDTLMNHKIGNDFGEAPAQSPADQSEHS